jgi:hypothetical protein
MHLLTKKLLKEIIVLQQSIYFVTNFFLFSNLYFVLFFYRKSNDSNSSAALAFYSYDVELLSPKKKQNPNNEPIYRVDGVQIKRSKACFTRDRCRFFITHNVEYKNGLISLKVILI